MDPDSTYKIQQCFIMTSPESGLAKWAPELKYVTVTTNKIKRRVSYEGGFLPIGLTIPLSTIVMQSLLFLQGQKKKFLTRIDY